MSTNIVDRDLYKDEVLDDLAQSANIAQFVSFDPKLVQRFSRIRGFAANHKFESVERAIEALLNAASEDSVNIRSYKPETPEGAEFLQNFDNMRSVLSEVRRLALAGFHTIVNERIDVNDGGVSGVMLGNVIEFAPGGTPRSVEGGDIASLSRRVGLQILRTVYGFRPDLDYPRDTRVEFSLHPLRRGFAQSQTIIWQIEKSDVTASKPRLDWPNAFSRLLGDKAYGLLVADAIGFPVPRTLVISRRVAAFDFGTKTGEAGKWLRTCPKEATPGQFSTIHGWADPFDLMAREDPRGELLASVLVQDEVPPRYSGGALANKGGEAIIEGVRGTGEGFMIGSAPPEPIPGEVERAVRQLCQQAVTQLGAIRLEWVYDGAQAWVVQLQQEAPLSSGITIVAGKARSYRLFDVSCGIEQLRQMISGVGLKNEGIILVGRVGMTSHFADILRRGRIPSKLAPNIDVAQQYIRS